MAKKTNMKNICEEYARESEEQYRQLVELSQNAIVLIDNKGVFRTVNPAACYLFGYSSAEEMIGLPVLKTYLPEDYSSYAQRLKQIKLGESPRFERKAIRKDGQVIDVEVSTTPIDHKRYQAIIRDITERKKTDSTIKKQNHVLAIIGDSNEALIRISDEKELLNEICRIAVEDNGYTMAWIGYANNDKSKSVSPVAYYGFEEKYLEKLKAEWADTPRGQGPASTAIRTSKTVICQNILTDPKFSTRRKEALSRGYESSISLPLSIESKTIGVLNIYSPEKESFKEDEVKLLTKLANNLAFGINVIRERNKNKKTEEKYSVLVEKSNDSILIMQDGLLKYVNEAACKMTGFTKEEVLEKSFLIYIAPDYRKIAWERYEKRLKGQDPPNNYELEVLSKNGQTTPVEVNAFRNEYAGRPAVMAIMRNITERKKTEDAKTEKEFWLKESQRVAKIGSYLLDIKKNAWTSSDELDKLFGIGADYKHDINGWLKIVHPEHAQMMADYFQNDVLKQKKVFNKEYKIVNQKDKRVLWVHGLGELIFDNKKTPVKMLGTIQDITDRKTTEEALREKEEQWKAVVENEPECVKILDREGHLLEMNPAGLAMIRATLKQVQNQKVVNLVAKEHQDAFNKMVEDVFSGKTVHLVFDMIGLKGKRLILETTSVPLRDLTGKITSLLGVTRDITERSRAENEIKKSEEKFRALFESAKAGIFLLNPDGKITDINKSFAEMHGYTTEELLKMGIKELDTPETAKLIPERMKKLLSGESLMFEAEHYRKDGSIIPLDVSASLVKIGDKKCILGFHHDITARKKSEENFHRIFDESPVGIVTVGLDLKYIKVNKTFCEFVGYNEEELLLLGIKDLTHPNHLASDLGKIKKLLAGEIPTFKTEKRYIKKNGDIVWGLTTVRLVTEKYGNTYLLGTIENITFKKIAEEQLLKKVEEINSFFDITPDLMCISDASGKFLRLNRSWEKNLGYEVKDLLNKKILDLVHPEDKELTQKLLNLSTQEPLIDYVNRYLAKDGSYHKLEWRSRPIGGIVYSTARDVTERKEKVCEPLEK